MLGIYYIPLSSCMEGETCVESGPLLSESGLCLGGVTSVFFNTLGGLTLGFLIWGFTEVFCGSCSISFCSSTLSCEIWLSYAYNTIITGFMQARLCKFQGLFNDFQKTFILFSRTENLRKILIYTLKFYF